MNPKIKVNYPSESVPQIRDLLHLQFKVATKKKPPDNFDLFEVSSILKTKKDCIFSVRELKGKVSKSSLL